MKYAIIATLLLGCGETDKSLNTEDTAQQDDGLCETAFYYQTENQPDAVRLAGEFNDWDPDDILLEEWAEGQWSTSIRNTVSVTLWPTMDSRVIPKSRACGGGVAKKTLAGAFGGRIINPSPRRNRDRPA